MKFTRFNTRALLIFVALVGAGLAIYRWTTREERAIRVIEQFGGQVTVSDILWDNGVARKERWCNVLLPNDWRGEIAELRLLTQLPTLYSLEIEVPIGDPEIFEIAKCRELGRLAFHAGRVTTEGVSQLQHLPQLRQLSIQGESLTSAAFNGVGPFPSLTMLQLSGTGIDDRVCETLRTFPKLDRVFCDDTGVSDHGLSLLTDLASLEVVSLKGTRVTDEGLLCLARLKSLESVYLGGVLMTREGAVALLRACPGPPWVTYSDLNSPYSQVLNLDSALMSPGESANEQDANSPADQTDIPASQTQKPEPSLVIEHCNVFDPASGKMTPDQTIVIRGAKIERVVDSSKAGDLPAEAERIDERGKFAVPGLIDAHVHLVHVLDFAHVTGDEVLPLYLAAGVTSIRSTGDEPVAATLVARFAAANAATSPRVFTCSPLLDADPPIHRDVGRAITDPAKVPALFDDLARWQPTTVKIYAGTARPVGRAIIEESHRRGLFVTAHLGAYSAQDAVSDGIDGLEHIWSVFNYVIPPEVSKEPGHRGRLDLNNPLCESLVAELAKHKTYVDPTLAVFRNMILLSDVPEIRDHPDNALAPKRLREFWPEYLKRSGCPQGGTLADRRREFAKFQELTGKLYRAGVPLLVGTDSPEPNVTPGFALHQELEMLVESGLPPAAALRAATLNNATALREQERLGSIVAGKLADFVLLSANPLDDIRNTRRIELVLRGGQVCRPAELLKRAPQE